jgi:hypothetical protein
MKKLIYTGSGIVGVPGVGEVSPGGTIEMSDELAAKYLEEQPQHFKEATAPRPRRGGGD